MMLVNAVSRISCYFYAVVVSTKLGVCLRAIANFSRTRFGLMFLLQITKSPVPSNFLMSSFRVSSQINPWMIFQEATSRMPCLEQSLFLCGSGTNLLWKLFKNTVKPIKTQEIKVVQPVWPAPLFHNNSSSLCFSVN